MAALGDDEPAEGFAESLSRLRHDLRTPVGHIIGFAEFLEEDNCETAPDEFVRDLQAIRSSGERLVAMIEEHLGASRRSVDDIDLTEVQFQLRMQLNHISGYSEICRETASEEGWDGIEVDLDRIAAAEAYLERLLEQRLDAGALGSSDVGGETAPGSGTADLQLELHSLAQGGSILVIDNDPIDRELLERRLTRFGFRVLSAPGFAMASELAAAGEVDLILLELLIGDVSGLDVLRELKSDPVTRHLPVIMVSAMDDLEPMVSCVLAGADDYIVKPLHPVLLRARIGASLEKVRLRQRFTRQLRIFISSPGDVVPERRVARQVISDLDLEFGDDVTLVPVLWEEEPLLASETFQSQIVSPSDTDIYLGIIWSRIGSPLPEQIVRDDGSAYESGTVFEFEDAMAGFSSSGNPQILMYRKDGAPRVSISDRGEVMVRLEQMEMLDAYLDRWFHADDGSFVAADHHFADLDELEQMLTTHLRKLVSQWLEDHEFE